MHVGIHACMHVCIPVCIYACVYVCTYVGMYICNDRCIYLSSYLSIYLYTWLYTYIIHLFVYLFMLPERLQPYKPSAKQPNSPPLTPRSCRWRHHLWLFPVKTALMIELQPRLRMSVDMLEALVLGLLPALALAMP